MDEKTSKCMYRTAALWPRFPFRPSRGSGRGPAGCATTTAQPERCAGHNVPTLPGKHLRPVGSAIRGGSLAGRPRYPSGREWVCWSGMGDSTRAWPKTGSAPFWDQAKWPRKRCRVQARADRPEVRGADRHAAGRLRREMVGRGPGDQPGVANLALGQAGLRQPTLTVYEL